MQQSLGKYRAKFGGKKLHYDLSQSIQRARTTLKNGELCCLATSSTFIWSEVLKRTFSGQEKIRSLCYPLDGVNLTQFPENTLSKMAGNGMFIPNVGWATLAHVLSLVPASASASSMDI